ncbi:MAG: hypothetical protein A2516_10750 [Alphaproteobacteria bacterium RIFOXYD12_FULL_60_8]|nr:MAG: hypothetical protein A2516_10750 [Alphaproteobacteria bacterium RIFOXYD12_FULL_60_8]
MKFFTTLSETSRRRRHLGAFLAVFALLFQAAMPMAPGALSSDPMGAAFLPSGAICSITASGQTSERGGAAHPSEHCPACFAQSLGQALIPPTGLLALAPRLSRFLHASGSQADHASPFGWSPLQPRAPPLHA